MPLDSALGGIDSVLSTVQMPKGVPVATMSIGRAGAQNAALLAAAILALSDADLAARLKARRERTAAEVTEKSKRVGGLG